MSTVQAGPSDPPAPEGVAPAAATAGVPVGALVGHDESPAAVDDAVAAEGRDRSQTVVATWFLRAGLAFVFLYAAAATLVDPVAASTYFPDVAPPDMVIDVLLPSFAAYEVLLAAALVTKRFTFPASVLATVTLVGIMVVNADAFGVLFRNVAIACAALALAIQSRAERTAERTQPEAGPDAHAGVVDD